MYAGLLMNIISISFNVVRLAFPHYPSVPQSAVREFQALEGLESGGVLRFVSLIVVMAIPVWRALYICDLAVLLLCLSYLLVFLSLFSLVVPFFLVDTLSEGGAKFFLVLMFLSSLIREYYRFIISLQVLPLLRISVAVVKELIGICHFIRGRNSGTFFHQFVDRFVKLLVLVSHGRVYLFHILTIYVPSAHSTTSVSLELILVSYHLHRLLAVIHGYVRLKVLD